MTDKIRIRKVEDGDLAEIFPMIDKENWDWRLPEVERVLTTDKEHSIAAVLDGKIAGILFVLRNGDFAEWTHFIVKEKYRGMGIGGALMDHVFKELRAAGVDTIELMAVTRFASMYADVGFAPTEEILVHVKTAASISAGKADAGSNHCRVVKVEALEKTGAVKRLEEKTGCLLGEMVGKLIFHDEFPAIGYFEGDVLTGLMLSNVADNEVDIGPWLIQDVTMEKAMEMLRFAAGVFPGKKFYLCTSLENGIAKKLIESEGFQFDDRFVRMVRSDRPAAVLKDNLVSIGKF